MSIPHCPNVFASPIERSLRDLGVSWARSSEGERPRPSETATTAWACLLDEWLREPSLPLLVRKSGLSRGQGMRHASGRVLVPCDNSPAHWAFALALRGQCPSLAGIGTMSRLADVPVAMVFKQAERLARDHGCRLSKDHSLSQHGWKLAHIKSVGVRKRTSLVDLPETLLSEHFLAFLSPANMFVVPLPWSGLAETSAFLSGFRGEA
jgi:hypothetical protein